MTTLRLLLIGLFITIPSIGLAKTPKPHICTAQHFLGGKKIEVKRRFKANGEEIGVTTKPAEIGGDHPEISLVEEQLDRYITDLAKDLPKNCPQKRKREHHYHYFDCSIHRRIGNQRLSAGGRSVNWRYEVAGKIELSSVYTFFGPSFQPQLAFPSSPFGGPAIHWNRLGGWGYTNSGREIDGKTVWTYAEAAQIDFGGNYMRSWTTSNVLVTFNQNELLDMLKTGSSDANLVLWSTQDGVIERHKLPRAIFTELGANMQSIYAEYTRKSLDLVNQCEPRAETEITITLH